MNREAIIAAQGLSIDYRLKAGWFNAVRDISLSIQPFEIHGLVGESGSGKSTLALAMMNYLERNARISAGTIQFEGVDLVKFSPQQMQAVWGSRINLVPQDPLAALNPSFTVGNQMSELTQRHLGLNPAAAQQTAIEMLRQVRIADPMDVIKRYPHQLSGGMRQRVMIAMALSTHPKLLVLDEPTTALDVTTQAVILDLFRDLIKDNQAAALYVSHDLGSVAQLCDRVTVLYAGEVMESASVVEIFEKPLHPYTAGLLASLPRRIEGSETRLSTIAGVAPSLTERPHGCVFAPRCPVAIERCHAEKPPLESTPDGRMARCWRWREIADESLSLRVAPSGENISTPPRKRHILDVQGLSKQFETPSLLSRLLRRNRQPVHAVDEVSVTINARSTLGLVGESGSGKTTLARSIVALYTADSGKLKLDERPISLRLSERPKEALRDLRMVFQNPNEALNPYHTIGQAIRRTLRRLGDHAPTRAEADQRVADLLRAVRLPPDYARRYPAELSGGEKQRAAIARAFAAEPALIIADEPTSSLDVSVQAVILNLLKDLRAEKGSSYLVISHDLEVVAYLADWIAVMYLGQIIEEGPNERVFNAPSHPYTEALVSAIPTHDLTQRSQPIRLDGEVPSPRDVPTGCRFHTRCPRKLGAICEETAPPWQDGGEGHMIRCHIPIDQLIEVQSIPIVSEGILS